MKGREGKRERRRGWEEDGKKMRREEGEGGRWRGEKREEGGRLTC